LRKRGGLNILENEFGQWSPKLGAGAVKWGIVSRWLRYQCPANPEKKENLGKTTPGKH